ncbi:tRNA guanosine-2'-O-methyltransferase [Thozetella sp. PMI_491]|nr:tRNA guanosine-2'-O-methyltransferase [Thozetella sp. PMI_491]
MDYLIRLSQSHETFRLPEIQSLAVLEGIEMEVKSYSLETPFLIVRLPSNDAALRLIRRSILAMSVYELWGSATTLDELHAVVRAQTEHMWDRYMTCSFKLAIDCFQGSRTSEEKVALINAFAYLGFAGPIKMRSPDEEFTLFEEWAFNAVPLNIPDPNRYYFGRYLGMGARDLPKKLDLKKRRYISTTSMDAELSLVTANMALAAPGKLLYDPFAGTGSFPIACAQFGALVFGSDIDGRAIRGEGHKTLKGNFEQYGFLDCLGGTFTADLTNSPMRRRPAGSDGDDGMTGRLFDGILCDPPYGVREGLRVLGVKDPEKNHWVIPKGKEMYKQADFIPPKKPYSLFAILDDILEFAADTLVDHGRLSFWIPTANDEEQEVPTPTHPFLEVVAVSTQTFTKWSRRLITYQRLPNSQVDLAALKEKQTRQLTGKNADELNPFRKMYFTTKTEAQ